MTIKEIQGSCLDTQEQYVLQQCDCISTVATNLDADFVREFPWADVYGERENMKGWRNLASISTRGTPGDVKIFDGGKKETIVIALFSQRCPGRPFTGMNKNKRFKDDTAENREKWFAECLKKVTELKPKSVAMPHMLGCLGNGGNWEKYSDAIQSFSDENPDCKVYIYNDSS